MHRSLTKIVTLLVLAAPVAMVTEAAARPVRGGTRTSVGSYNRSASVDRSANVNRNYNANVSRNYNNNVNVHRDIDVDVDRHYGGYGYGHGYGYNYHPAARAAAVGTAAVATAAVVGSVVSTLPPSCVATNVGGVVYQQCGSSWYMPRYYGSSVQYVVVNPP
jgi:hypothetical protein